MTINKTNKKSPKEKYISDMALTFKIFLVFSGLIVWNIFAIQFGPDAEKLRSDADSLVYKRVTIKAHRGNIFARDGRVLATSVPMYEFRMDFGSDALVDSLFYNPRTKKNYVKDLADSLSSMFGDASSATYENRISKYLNDKNHSNRYVKILPRRVNYTEMQRLKKFPIWKNGQRKTGLIIVPSTKRILPHGSMASRTIGNVNEDGKGSGLEISFNEELSGKDGSSIMRKVSGSFRVPEPDESNSEPVDGQDIVTTLDIDVQDVADASLRRQILEQEAEWGTAILMEVETGEIRAMANITRRGDKLVEDYNHALGQLGEPGSTMKLASLIVLLEDAGMSLSDTIDTGSGSERVNGYIETDTRRGGYGLQSLKGVFEHSSNIGFAKAVTEHYNSNPQRFVDQLRKLGLDKDLEFQISGAARTKLYGPDSKLWSKISFNKLSYGYFIYITPLHVLTFYNAVANKGKMVAPMIVSELRSYGNTIKTFKPRTIVEKICSDKTLADIHTCLKGVVTDGTGALLQNDYYEIACKTGTAQVYNPETKSYKNPRDGSCRYLATMVGYFPADNPKYTCIVSIQTLHRPGSTKRFYGGSLAGPVFRDIANRIVSKDYMWQKELSDADSAATDRPKIKSGNATIKEIRRIAKSERLNIDKIEGKNGDYNRFSWRGDTLVTESIKIDSSRMPNVNGMGLRDAVKLLEGMGMKVRHTGRGTVVNQSPAAGSIIRSDNNVTLTLAIK
jgi:cell division protein FtsI (penicillin-binding protein 3)